MSMETSGDERRSKSRDRRHPIARLLRLSLSADDRAAGAAQNLARKPGSSFQTDEASWAAAELKFWNERALASSLQGFETDHFIDAHETLFRLDIRGAQVTIAERRAMHPGLALLKARAELYRRLFEDVIRTYKLEISCTIILDTNDAPTYSDSLPIWGFQKTADNPAILLPDVDMLDSSFYFAEAYRDTQAFESKSDTAIFVGSTTGGGWIDEAAVREGRVPRIVAAQQFRKSQRVVFELPQIVQTQTEEVTALIQGLDLGSHRYSWAEQFACKVLLSMDGNGATCSRVFIALMSQSLLAKFASPYELYYFRGLQPDYDIISIDSPDEVEPLLDDIAANLERYVGRVKSQQNFAATHLCRPAVYEYTAELLIRYAQICDGKKVELNGRALAPAEFLSDAVATSCSGRRLAGINAWMGSPRSRVPLQAFRISISPRIPLDALTCRVLDKEGREYLFEGAGIDCHIPGGRDLYGAAAHMTAPTSDLFSVSYEALFTDGYATGPVDAHTMARSPSGAPLEAFRLSVRQR